MNAGPRKHSLDTAWDVWQARRCQCKCSTLCSPLRLPAEIARIFLSAEAHGAETKRQALHWMTIQDYSTSAHWRTEMASSSNHSIAAHQRVQQHTGEPKWHVFFLQAEITALPKGTKLQIHNTEQGEIGMIGPTAAFTPQGPADTGYAGDCWQFNTKGKLVRVHRQYRKTLFTPSRTPCPVPEEQLEDYRRTTTRFQDGITNTFEDKCQIMEMPHHSQQQMWKGETAFRTNQRHYSDSVQQRHSHRRSHHK